MRNERQEDIVGFMDRMSVEDMSTKLVRNIKCWTSKGMNEETIEKNLKDTFEDVSVYRRPDFRTACVNAFFQLDATDEQLKSGKDALLALGRKIEAKFPNIVREAHAPGPTL